MEAIRVEPDTTRRLAIKTGFRRLLRLLARVRHGRPLASINVLDQLFDAATEIAAQSIQRVGTHTVRVIEHSRQRDPSDAGRVSHLKQSDPATFPELLVGNSFLELEPEHLPEHQMNHN